MVMNDDDNVKYMCMEKNGLAVIHHRNWPLWYHNSTLPQ